MRESKSVTKEQHEPETSLDLARSVQGTLTSHAAILSAYNRRKAFPITASPPEKTRKNALI